MPMRSINDAIKDASKLTQSAFYVSLLKEVVAMICYITNSNAEPIPTRGWNFKTLIFQAITNPNPGMELVGFFALLMMQKKYVSKLTQIAFYVIFI
jgi:hypothetical protein